MIRRDLLINYRQEAKEQRLLHQSMALMENLGSQLDPDMSGWGLIGGDSRITTGRLATLDELRIASLRATYQDPNGRGIIRTFVKFIIGQGIVIDFHEKDENKLQQIWDWWNTVARLNKWFSLLREFVTRAFRDGEVFLRKIIMNGSPIFRFIEPGKITDPAIRNANISEGIEVDPNDAETVIAYYVNMKDKWERIDAADVIHFKMNVDRNVRRGRPELETVLPLFAKYAKWLDARIVLNIIRTNVALVREVQGSPGDVLRLRGQQASTASTSIEQDKTKMMRPGTIITATPGVKYNMISSNIDARDAAQDGRNIQLAMAAAEGLPDVFVTGDYAQANFASTVVSQNPAIRAFEEYQNLFREPFTDMVEWILKAGVGAQEIAQSVDLDFDISYPPLLKRDLRQDVEAWQIMHQEEIASRRTWQVNMGLNPDQEKKFLEEEGPPPAAKPTAIKPAPIGVADRQPRQNVRAESKKIAMKIVPIKEAQNGTHRTFNIECEIGEASSPGQKSFVVNYERQQPIEKTDSEQNHEQKSFIMDNEVLQPTGKTDLERDQPA